MSDPYNLQRFVDAQEGDFSIALSEIRAGSKQSHWIWFIFPQLAGLGRSPTAHFYGIGSLDEARAYLGHSTLGPNLRECVEALMPWVAKRTAEQIFGPIDAMKLKSSLTLFEAASGDPLFGSALDAFFGGQRDDATLALLNAQA
jgi:uncharacterized protein (DUF1810 family)